MRKSVISLVFFMPLSVVFALLSCGGSGGDAEQEAAAGESCGGEEELDCASGLFCRFETGVCRGQGVCEQIPEFCTMDFNPVCACDGSTYSNTCSAHARGVSVRFLGECPDS